MSTIYNDKNTPGEVADFAYCLNIFPAPHLASQLLPPRDWSPIGGSHAMVTDLEAKNAKRSLTEIRTNLKKGPDDPVFGGANP